jgi:hypothetical protein
MATYDVQIARAVIHQATAFLSEPFGIYVVLGSVIGIFAAYLFFTKR